MKNKVSVQFSRMHKNAFYLLSFCFNIILFSLCAFYIYLDTSKTTEIFPFLFLQKHIITVYLSSVTLSLVGAFLLDYAYIQ